MRLTTRHVMILVAILAAYITGFWTGAREVRKRVDESERWANHLMARLRISEDMRQAEAARRANDDEPSPAI